MIMTQPESVEASAKMSENFRPKSPPASPTIPSQRVLKNMENENGPIGEQQLVGGSPNSLELNSSSRKRPSLPINGTNGTKKAWVGKRDGHTITHSGIFYQLWVISESTLIITCMVIFDTKFLKIVYTGFRSLYWATGVLIFSQLIENRYKLYISYII